MDQESHASRTLKVSDEDRDHVARLMSQPASIERDTAVATVLMKYFGRLITVEPVPEGHMHDGKIHEGIEIHFRDSAHAGEEDVGIIGGCTVVMRPPTDPNAGMCYLDPPGICRLC